MSHKYLDDPEIQKLLEKVDEAVSVWQSARMRGDYSGMSFALGALYGVVQQIYNRNDQIDRGVAMQKLKEETTPSISEEVLAAFPGVDPDQLAYEGERPPRIGDDPTKGLTGHEGFE